MKFTTQDLRAIVDSQDSVETHPWKHGSLHKYIVQRDGRNYAVNIPFHTYEGAQIDYYINGYEVTPVERTVTEWVRVPTPSVAAVARVSKEGGA